MKLNPSDYPNLVLIDNSDVDYIPRSNVKYAIYGMVPTEPFRQEGSTCEIPSMTNEEIETHGREIGKRLIAAFK